jgi:hypothetical protein
LVSETTARAVDEFESNQQCPDLATLFSQNAVIYIRPSTFDYYAKQM